MPANACQVLSPGSLGAVLGMTNTELTLHGAAFRSQETNVADQGAWGQQLQTSKLLIYLARLSNPSPASMTSEFQQMR